MAYKYDYPNYDDSQCDIQAYSQLEKKMRSVYTQRCHVQYKITCGKKELTAEYNRLSDLYVVLLDEWNKKRNRQESRYQK